MTRDDFILQIQHKSEWMEAWQGDAMEMLHAIQVLAGAQCYDAISEPAGKLWDILTERADEE